MSVSECLRRSSELSGSGTLTRAVRCGWCESKAKPFPFSVEEIRRNYRDSSVATLGGSNCWQDGRLRCSSLIVGVGGVPEPEAGWSGRSACRPESQGEPGD
ncbi:hypothetical protein DY000_02010563 [Brassica cretica]|uniref:Uncharacterized protein n=1 Tax=Brassica cretica TaxID=69181 RepID=A0ABQ7C216_BRACR|nr:hypothetical protein DY000_02010563 [Brassica cretica]